MMKTMRSNSICISVMGALFLFGGGCAADRPATAAAPTPPGPTANFARVQMAAGARADATLYPQHFDGQTLNSLGRAKLKMMLGDNEMALPLVVYVDSAKNTDLTDARRRAVTLFLKDHGLRDSQIALRDGANPATLHPADDAITRLPKTENPAPQGAVQNTDDSGEAAFPSSPASMNMNQ